MRPPSSMTTIGPLSLERFSNTSSCFAVLASLLVKDGIDPQQLTSLATLLDPAMAKRGLGLLLRGGQTTPKAAATANALCSIARYLDLPKEQVAELSKLARKLRTRPTGMAPKNKQRLAPLKDPSIKRKLVQLPLKIAREMEKIDKPTHAQATRMRFAVAVGILQFAPMRVSNLASLDRERHMGQLSLGDWSNPHLHPCRRGKEHSTSALPAS